MSKAPGKGQKTQALYALHWIPNLKPSSRMVGAWLVWHANASSGRCDPGQTRLQAETGLSRRAVQYAVQELEKKQIIKRRLRGGPAVAVWRSIDQGRDTGRDEGGPTLGLHLLAVEPLRHDGV